jgi:hypothetical protein
VAPGRLGAGVAPGRLGAGVAPGRLGAGVAPGRLPEESGPGRGPRGTFGSKTFRFAAVRCQRSCVFAGQHSAKAFCPEKRKVGGSIPPLPTLSELRFHDRDDLSFVS